MGELQKHKNAKQECGSTGEREKKFRTETREREGKIEERRHAGTQRSTGTRAHLCFVTSYKKAMNLYFSSFMCENVKNPYLF